MTIMRAARVGVWFRSSGDTIAPGDQLRLTEASIKMGYHGGTKSGGDENDQEDVQSA
jgi:hypothetical protein